MDQHGQGDDQADGQQLQLRHDQYAAGDAVGEE
jgi:hypothetical protein